MASLTHVCMWSEKGWKRITATEAARLHPGGTVSAHSGLFMCELCGQYVLLTEGGMQVRHFRHSSAEQSKDCPERTFGTGAIFGYSPEEHELPIRITKITSSSFSLEMGLVRVPQNLLTPQLQITIKSNSHTFTYVKERINVEGITYLSIGNIPDSRYSVEVTGTAKEVYQFWPKVVQGINPTGTVFDASTGKRLVNDADVVVGKKYYLLRKGSIYRHRSAHITCTEISCQTISWETWRVYEVTANDYDAESAKFFLNYHCRLTEQPISIQPVWPVYVESPYVIKHDKESIIIHLTGDALKPRVFPYAPYRSYSCGHGSVIEVEANSRQQLISAGRTKALQYTYFWREPLNRVTERPRAEVLDLHDVPIEAGENYELPDRRIVSATVPYDGTISIKHGEFLIEKRKLQANEPIEIDNIIWNTELEICVGLDVVWKTYFCKKKKILDAVNENAILKKLESYAGPQMRIPHTVGSVAVRLSEYPLIRQWLYKRIRSGYMSEHAYRDLQTIISSVESNSQNKQEGSI